MSNPRISIIVPVFNVEKYISYCISSILGQTCQDFELILVDDGSTDGSGKICDLFTSKDKRVIAFHLKNGGVGAARNFGLSKARGEYIMFVDGDDWISPECLDECLKNFETHNLDILQFSYQRITNDGCIIYQDWKQSELQESADFIKNNQYLANVCCSVFDKKIIKENNILFDENLKLGEDQLFLYSYLVKCKYCLKINNHYYYYRYNTESATHNCKVEDLLYSIKVFQNFKYKDIFRIRIEDTLMNFLNILMKFSRKRILNSEIYNLYSGEEFGTYLPQRKIDRIFLCLDHISRYMAIVVTRIIINLL